MLIAQDTDSFDDDDDPGRQFLENNIHSKEIEQLYVKHNEVLSYTKKISVYWIVISTLQWFFFCCRWYIWILYARELGEHNSNILAFSAYSVYFIQAFSNLCWGYIADKYSYDIIGMLLMFCVLIGLIMESFATQFLILLIGTIIVDIFRAHQTICIAFLTLYLPNYYAVKYQSYRFAFMGISNLVGPLFAGILVDFINIKYPFYCSVVVAGISLLILIFIINGTQKKIHLNQSNLKKLYDMLSSQNNNNDNINYKFEGDDLLNPEYQFPMNTEKYIIQQNRENNIQNNNMLTIYEWFMLANIIISNSTIMSIEAVFATYFVVFCVDLYNVSVAISTSIIAVASIFYIIACLFTPLLLNKYANIHSDKYNLELILILIGSIVMIEFCIFTKDLLGVFHVYWLWVYGIMNGLGIGYLDMLTEILLLKIQPKQHAAKISGIKVFCRNIMSALITLMVGSLWNVSIYWFLYAQSIFYGLCAICAIFMTVIHIKCEMRRRI